MNLVISLPYEILKGAAWIHIRHLLIRTLSSTLIILIHQETTPYTGLIIRLLTTMSRLMSNTSNQDECTDRREKIHRTQKRRPKPRKRKKSKKRKTNLRWYLRHKAKPNQDEHLKEKDKNRGPPMGDKDREPTILETAGDTAPKISQYDGNADSEPESDEEQGPLENIQASKCGWHRTKTEEYPKGISFWSDPNRPPEEIIAVPPPLGTPPKDKANSQQNMTPQCWINESNEVVEEDIQIPDAEIERTQILTMNVRSCYSGRKMM